MSDRKNIISFLILINSQKYILMTVIPLPESKLSEIPFLNSKIKSFAGYLFPGFSVSFCALSFIATPRGNINTDKSWGRKRWGLKMKTFIIFTSHHYNKWVQKISKWVKSTHFKCYTFLIPEIYLRQLDVWGLMSYNGFMIYWFKRLCANINILDFFFLQKTSKFFTLRYI